MCALHKMVRNYTRLLLAGVAFPVLLASCSEDSAVPNASVEEVETPSSFEIVDPELDAAVREIALNYVAQVEKDLGQVEVELGQLQSLVQTFLNQSTTENMDSVRRRWLSAHNAYELTVLHRYFAIQLLSEQQSLELLQLQYQINHWPIVPGYIDYVDGYPDSGIVHDVNVQLDSPTLREQHGSFDISEVTLGFHVIEFLLWGLGGEDGIRAADDFTSIEQLDQQQIENGFTIEQLSSNRRRALLAVITNALLNDFRALQSLWIEQLPNTLREVESASGSKLIVILTDSMAAMLTEELLVRSLYPMLNGDLSESIHSPYSLSTQNAVSTQLLGLETLLLELQAGDGTTLDQIFSGISSDFSELFYQNFDASKSCLVLLYSNMDSQSANPSTDIEIVECINLLTNMVDHIERLKFELDN